MVLFELGVSEDILKECVGLNAQGAKSYTKRPKGQDREAQCSWWVRVTRGRGSSCVDGTIA